MKSNIQIYYYRKRESLLYMIQHYEENCNRYLHLDMPICDIEELYDFDKEYVKRYQNELLLLNQKTWN